MILIQSLKCSTDCVCRHLFAETLFNTCSWEWQYDLPTLSWAQWGQEREPEWALEQSPCWGTWVTMGALGQIVHLSLIFLIWAPRSVSTDPGWAPRGRSDPESRVMVQCYFTFLSCVWLSCFIVSGLLVCSVVGVRCGKPNDRKINNLHFPFFNPSSTEISKNNNFYPTLLFSIHL